MCKPTDKDAKATADMIAKLFVHFLVRGTDPVKNEAHKIAPCPVVIWEDFYNQLDDEWIDPDDAVKH